MDQKGDVGDAALHGVHRWHPRTLPRKVSGRGCLWNPPVSGLTGVMLTHSPITFAPVPCLKLRLSRAERVPDSLLPWHRLACFLWDFGYGLRTWHLTQQSGNLDSWKRHLVNTLFPCGVKIQACT